jgi:hypothetical protein
MSLNQGAGDEVLNQQDEEQNKNSMSEQNPDTTSESGEEQNITLDPEAFLKALEGVQGKSDDTNLLKEVNEQAGKSFSDVQSLVTSLKNADQVASASGEILKELDKVRKELAELKGGTVTQREATPNANQAIIDSLVLKEISPLTTLVAEQLKSIASVANMSLADVWNANIGGVKDLANLEKARLDAIESVNKNINKPSDETVQAMTPNSLKDVLKQRQELRSRRK